MAKVKSVRSGSLAEELELEAGDEILAIDGQSIRDIVDLQFALAGESIEIAVRKASGEEWLVEVEKGYDETLGVEWEHPTVDRVRLCHNKCVFCFVDQIPGNMRKTLNMRDDDYRLSFLHGNFVTLTNLKPGELERIADRAAFFHQGRVVLEASTEEAKRDVRRIQVIFANGLPEEVRVAPGVLRVEQSGRMHSLIVDRDPDRVLALCRRHQPEYLEELDVDFEELFIHVMHREGYAHEQAVLS